LGFTRLRKRMRYRLLADLLVVVHLAFIVFVVIGGWLVIRRRWWAALHAPAVVWAVWIEWSGAICPLTPWEQTLLRAAGEAGYNGGFIEHYLLPVIYPGALTPGVQWVLGALVLVINAVTYTIAWRKGGRCRE
jgi:hypothetical protein